MMTNQEIAVFLEDTRVKLQLVMDEKFRPKYKANTWLKQTDMHPNERILMQLIDEVNGNFSVSDLANITGLSTKCVRDNFGKLVDKGLIKKVGTGFNYAAITII